MKKSTKLSFTNSQLMAQKVAALTTFFALIYHAIFLIIFSLLGFYNMAKFNIASVVFFFITIFLLKKPNANTILYFLSCVEVITHQIMAMHALGGDSGFHYLILIMIVIPYLALQNKKRYAIPSSLVCGIIFVLLEGFRDRLVLNHPLAENILKCINYSNITLSILIVIGAILIYSVTSSTLETQLSNEVESLAQQMQSKNEQLLEIQNNTINGLSSLVENRDSDTGKHNQRTSAYVKLLAEALKSSGFFTNVLTDDYISILVKAAPMHDIGKIVVPDEILKKPGKLTAEEFEKMQKHAIEGGRIIRDIVGNTKDTTYIRIADEIATSHHEKWNGKGYPYQLKQTEIPLSARIMAIADVFDALVSPRCYKEPFSVDKAFEIIKNDIGEHFDPTIARIFLENRTKVESVMNQYLD